MTVRIRPYDPHLAADLIERLRSADRRELALLGGQTPRGAFDCIEGLPGEAWLACVDGRPVAAFGCVSGWLGRIGTPWFLAAPEVHDYPVTLVRVARDVVARWARTYLLLENYCDASCGSTIDWLRRLGFVVDEPFRLPGGGLVSRFWRRGGGVCATR